MYVSANVCANVSYMAKMGAIIAKAQITNGGPVILFQPENEYSSGYNTVFPNKKYMQYVIDQARKAGILVPLINNDSYPGGTGRPGTGEGEVDIYGFDSYPLGFDCANPSVWPPNNLPTTLAATHNRLSPQGPFSIIEFQGGSYDTYGGRGFDACASLVNHEFARVFDKNNLAAGVHTLNLYMIYGGTNWGNLGHNNGYTSYDYGASIREDRRVDREKYSEVKLEAQFMRVTPSYLLTVPGALSTTEYSDNPSIAVTPLQSNQTGRFFVVRHADYQTMQSATYTLKVPTSNGTMTIPRAGKLTLSGRDSKIHVVDYPVGDHHLLYSTAEIFTWQKFGDKTVLIVYGGPGEYHELAFYETHGKMNATQIEGDSAEFQSTGEFTGTVSWNVSPERQIIQLNDIVIYLLDRNSAYNYWVPVLPGGKDGPAYGSSVMNPKTVIVNGPYLVRSVDVRGSTLSINADFNKTTTVEVIGAPSGTTRLSINGQQVPFTTNLFGNWVAKPQISFPKLSLPNLSSLSWKGIDSLPEIKASYDDSKWTSAQNYTANSFAPLEKNTPVSLYGSDYGYNTGTLLFRGRFTSTGKESSLFLHTVGGLAYGSSVWLDDKFLGSKLGDPNNSDANTTLAIPALAAGSKHVITVVVDNMGLNENLVPGYDSMKEPRGIYSWKLTAADGTETKVDGWKITGNLGGETYKDRARGPLNEGGIFYERQGYHLPSPPLDKMSSMSPFTASKKAGISYYTAKFGLKLPRDNYDIPLSFNFGTDQSSGRYHAFLYVNGFQFGKYISYLGPQTEFPVPEGILNYDGDNWVGLGVWAVDEGGARVPGLELVAKQPVLSSRHAVKLVSMPPYSTRRDAY